MRSCQNHIEEILDIFMDDREEMPVMEQIDGETLTCQICGEKAMYQLLQSGVKTSWE
jgi:CxxH/CxxC protein (TIGR04129 family)